MVESKSEVIGTDDDLPERMGAHPLWRAIIRFIPLAADMLPRAIHGKYAEFQRLPDICGYVRRHFTVRG